MKEATRDLVVSLDLRRRSAGHSASRRGRQRHLAVGLLVVLMEVPGVKEDYDWLRAIGAIE